MNRTVLSYIFLTVFTFYWNFSPANIPADKDNTKISVIVIDPGHGGKDWGASIGSAKEKDIVLNIALKLGNEIKNNYPDIEVIYTRTNDVFIPLHKRAEIANKNNADLFLSIHVNAVDAKSVQGTETFVLGLHRNDDNLEVAKKENAVILLEDDYTTTYEGFDPNLPESYIMFETMQAEYQEQSIMLASVIQDEFRDNAKRLDRSVKMAGFLVLRNTTMPSVLIETGFLSHPKEREYLLSQSGQDKLALSIFKAFNIYKSEIEEKSRFSIISEDSGQDLEKENARSDVSEPLNEMVTGNPIKTINEEETDIYFSVQIMALKKKIEPTPANFKGEKEIFRVDDTKISRYFSGKFSSLEMANKEQNRISKKYKNAFVVAFKNNTLISVKKVLEEK